MDFKTSDTKIHLVKYWLRSVMYTMEPYSMVGCKPWCFWDILFSWLSSVMHTVESDSTVWCTLWSFFNIWIRKYFSLFIRGPDGFEAWKKGGQNLVTHSLQTPRWKVPIMCESTSWLRMQLYSYIATTVVPRRSFCLISSKNIHRLSASLYII